MFRARVRGRRLRRLTVALSAAAGLTLFLTMGAGSPIAAPAATCITPTFTNGLSQAVFPAPSPSNNPANYINEQGWVEAPFDSDFDGKPDRIHFDITRQTDTANPDCNLKVPVIFEDSPYYANLGPSRNWAVDHELGAPPASRAAEPYFTAANTNPQISNIYESTWLPRGYAVMHAESPGTGNSDGCPTSGAPNETLAAKAVIDWLNGRATAYTSRAGTTTMTADWTTGKVGMMGTSYNGTLPEAVSTTGVDGLAATVPISAISNWYDYYRANGAVRAPYTFQGEDLDVLEDAVYSRADEPAPQRLICQNYIRSVTQTGIDRATGDYNAFWDDRNYMKNVQNVKAPALIAHGNMDLNVMTKNMRQYLDALKAQGVPHQLYFHRGGHGGAPPDSMINRWFTRYLWNVQNGVENEPKAWVVRETNACPPRNGVVDGDQSNVTTLQVVSSSQFTYGQQVTIPVTSSTGTVSNSTGNIVAVPDATHIVLAAAVATATGSKVANGAALTSPCGTSSPTPYAEWPDPNASVANVNFASPGQPTSGELTFRNGSAATETLTDTPTITMLTDLNAVSSTSRLLYKSPVLTQNVRISGTVHVNLWMSFSKPRANLTAVLVDIPATGTNTSNSTFQERSTRGWLDPENRNSVSVSEPIVPGTFYRMHFDLQPKDLVAVAGRRLAVMIVSSDQEASIRPAAGTQLTLDLSQSWAEIPVVGGATALAQAFGDTAPTIASTLNPAAPTGSNGWYTGDVALAWQVNDGGAATTKTGCADETFSSDGTFSRSCSASNLLGSAGPVTVVVKRDATAPVTTASTSPASPDGSGGWFKTAPTVTLTGSDPTSGVAATTYSLDGGPSTAYTGPLSGFSPGSHTLTFSSTDNAGNAEATRSFAFKVDTEAPTTTAARQPASPGGLNGWDNVVPIWSLTASDPTAGVATTRYSIDGAPFADYTGPVSASTDGGHTLRFFSVDNAGNQEATQTVTWAIDRTAPTTTATLTPAIHNGWYASPTLTFSVADGAGSGNITDPCPPHVLCGFLTQYALDGGAWQDSTGPLSGFSTGNHFVQYRTTDKSGQVEAVKLIAFKVDAVKPSVTITAPADGATIPQDKVTNAKFKCTDAQSGIDTCVGTVANGAHLDTATVGQHTFTVTATDKAGNQTVRTVHYQVVYTYNGFFAPVTNIETQKLNLVHAGDLVKLGFGLNGNRGLTPFAAGFPTSVAISCPSWTPHSVPAAGAGASPGLQYGVASGHYTYGWQTQTGWANTCRRFEIQLNDGTSTLHTADFRFFS